MLPGHTYEVVSKSYQTALAATVSSMTVLSGTLALIAPKFTVIVLRFTENIL